MVSSTPPAALYPRERPGTHFTVFWVGPRAGLEGRKISSPPGFDPGPFSLQSVAIPTELPGPHTWYRIIILSDKRQLPVGSFIVLTLTPLTCRIW